MKYFKYFLLLIMLIPMNVFAEETCNNNEIIIKDLEFVKKTGLTEELSDATLTNNKIETDVKMYEVGDSIVYQFTIVNESDDVYAIDTKSLVDPNNHIEYILDSEDHSNRIKKESEKDFTLTATYKNEIEEESFRAGKYDGGINASLMITDPALINPMTGNFFYYMLIFILIICVLFGIKYKKNAITSLGIIGLLIVPLYTYAICTMNLDVDFNLNVGYVKPNPCTYNGNLVQGAEYTNGQYTYRYKQQMEASYWINIDNDGWGVILTDKDSTTPVTTTLCTSINNKPIVSMRDMFIGSHTSSIDTSSFDTSSVVNMYQMFTGVSNITEINVRNFDTSKVTNFIAMFYSATNLTELDLSSFDTSSLENSSYFAAIIGNTSVETLNVDNLVFSGMPYSMFSSASSLKNISARNWTISGALNDGIFRFMSGGENIETIDVTGWDTTNVTNLSGFFGNSGISGTKLKNIIGLSTWDTSNVTNMSNTFYGLSSLTNLDLSGWDTSNVTKMTSMFSDMSSLSSLNLSGFDFSKVIHVNYTGLISEITNRGSYSIKTLDFSNTILPSSLYYCFEGLYNVENIYLDNIDTSNVTNISFMFHNNEKLESLDLSSFDLSSVTNTSGLFSGCTSLNTVYARTNADLQILNSSDGKPSNVQVVLKS